MEIIRNRHQKVKPTMVPTPAAESAEPSPSSLDNIVRREYLVSRIYQILYTKTAYPIEKHYLRGHLVKNPETGRFFPSIQLLPVIIVSDICAIVVTEDCGVWFEFNAFKGCALYFSTMLGRMVFADFRVFSDTGDDPYHPLYQRGDNLDFQGYLNETLLDDPLWIEVKLYDREDRLPQYILKMVHALDRHKAFLCTDNSLDDARAVLQVLRSHCFAKADTRQQFYTLSERGMYLYQQYSKHYRDMRDRQSRDKPCVDNQQELSADNEPRDAIENATCGDAGDNITVENAFDNNTCEEE